jgi:hypothetical protein
VSHSACRTPECYRPSTAQRHLGTLRIASIRLEGTGSGAIRGLRKPATTVIGSTGCLGRVAEWQTRWLQVPVSFGTWGFKSPFAHKRAVLQTRRLKVTNSKGVVTLAFVEHPNTRPFRRGAGGLPLLDPVSGLREIG